MKTPLLAAVAALAVAGPALAQVWTVPALLGKASQSKPALAMAGAGYATVAFNYTGGGGNAVGTIYAERIQGAQAWTTAPVSISSSIDPFQPGLGQDISGADYLLFGAGQFDNLTSAYVGCMQGPGFGACGAVASSGAVQHPAAVRFFGASLTQPNTAVYLYLEKCRLIAGDTTGGSNGVLTQGADCASDFQLSLNALGTGVAAFRTTAGAMQASVRGPGPAGTWGAARTLAAANTLNDQIAAATAPSGETTVAWTVGKKGTATLQVWTQTLSAAGTWGPATQIAANACDVSVGVAMTPVGDAAVAYASKAKACEATVATRPEGGVFGSPRTLTVGAHTKAATVAATDGGAFVVAWSEGPAPMIRSATGTTSGFSAPQTIGAYAGAPVLAAAGGYVNAAWCSTLCYASTLVQP